MSDDQPTHFRVEQVTWESPLQRQLKAIRFSVFVDEQNVPAELEIDEFDPAALHVLARDPDGRPAGTGRYYAEPAAPGRAHIGRMAVLPEFRRAGCGAAILQTLLQRAAEAGFSEAFLQAQVHATGFYTKFGFQPTGETYLECDIPHQDMLLDLRKDERKSE